MKRLLLLLGLAMGCVTAPLDPSEWPAWATEDSYALTAFCARGDTTFIFAGGGAPWGTQVPEGWRFTGILSTITASDTTLSLFRTEVRAELRGEDWHTSLGTFTRQTDSLWTGLWACQPYGLTTLAPAQLYRLYTVEE